MGTQFFVIKVETCGEGKIESRVELREALVAIGAIHPHQLPDWQERQDAFDVKNFAEEEAALAKAGGE